MRGGPEMKKILLTGGSGYLARVIVPFLLKEYGVKVRLLARNEWRLVEALKHFNDKRVKMWVGDVRDRQRVHEAVQGCDLVIHAAALKRVEVCNQVPMEAIKTNIQGSLNVIESCMNLDTRLIFVSSDKAVRPLNLYGKTKSIIESVIKTYSSKKFQITRWGNVIGSTGAVVPYFIRLAKEGNPLPLTSPDMTRFMITKKNIIKTMKKAIGGKDFLILPEQIESVNMKRVAECIIRQLRSKSAIIQFPMTRAEKIDEELEIGMSSKDYLMSDERLIEILKEEGLL